MADKKDNDKDSSFKLVSNDEYDASLQSQTTGAQLEDKPYAGPERRKSSGERRNGPRDRRDMLRFEAGNKGADRRKGKDRRKGNNKPDDMWKQRDI